MEAVHRKLRICVVFLLYRLVDASATVRDEDFGRRDDSSSRHLGVSAWQETHFETDAVGSNGTVADVRGGEHRNGAPADHKEVCVTINVGHSTGAWETRRYMCNDRPEDVTPFSTCDSQDSWDWVKSSLQCGKF